MNLSSLGYADDIKQGKDTVGGGRTLLESDVYPATIKAAFLGTSSGGATSLTVLFDLGTSEYRETLYITNKAGKNFYTNSQGEKNYLPGFVTADEICLLAAQKPLAKMTTEKKVFKVYNSTAKMEVPTEVDALTELEGRQIKLGILQERRFKSVKQADGSYVDSSETQDSNIISKVFSAKHDKTANECRAQVEEASFIQQWKERWKGKLSDRTAGKAPASTAGNPGAPRAAMGAGKPTESLFN